MEKHHLHKDVHNYFVYKTGKMKKTPQDVINSLDSIYASIESNAYEVLATWKLHLYEGGEKLFCADEMVDDLVLYFCYKYVYENRFMAKW